MQNVHVGYFAVCQLWNSQTYFAYISQYSPIFFSISLFHFHFYVRIQYSFDVLNFPTAHIQQYISFICRNVGGFCVKMTFINISSAFVRGQMAKSVPFTNVVLNKMYAISLSLLFVLVLFRNYSFHSVVKKTWQKQIPKEKKRNTTTIYLYIFLTKLLKIHRKTETETIDLKFTISANMLTQHWINS